MNPPTRFIIRARLEISGLQARGASVRSARSTMKRGLGCVTRGPLSVSGESPKKDGEKDCLIILVTRATAFAFVNVFTFCAFGRLSRGKGISKEPLTHSIIGWYGMNALMT